MGLNYFYTDSQGNKIENPRFYRKGEKALNRLNRKKSKKYRKGQKQSHNYHKARRRYAKKHLRISRQRKDHAVKLARCVALSNDTIAYEDLRVSNLVKNHNLAKSIDDAGWYQFRVWLEYYGYKFGKVTVAVPPQYTSAKCSECGRIVTKTLSTRTHKCKCGCILNRDHNAAVNILKLGLRTVGHTGSKAWGDRATTLAGENLLEQVLSVNQESPVL